MKELLNEETFGQLLFNCNKYRGYEGIIVLKNTAEYTEFCDKLLKLHSRTPLMGLAEVYTSLRRTSVMFTNESRILITPCTELRGFGYHTLLYSSGLTETQISRVFQLPLRTRIEDIENLDESPFFELEYETLWHENVEDESNKELDDFLKTFKVTNQEI